LLPDFNLKPKVLRSFQKRLNVWFDLKFGGKMARTLKGISTIITLFTDASFTSTWYTPIGYPESFENRELQMLNDVRNGVGSPVFFPMILPLGIGPQEGFDPNIRNIGAAVGANTFVKNGWLRRSE
jgi:hypothetical protein